ncbi:helix-turn-helix domain-containing protein [Clostridium perfringens]|nr:helix-turn-helix domain-containing protein [Clostridium perfringens]
MDNLNNLDKDINSLLELNMKELEKLYTNMIDTHEIGKRINQIRKEKKLSQEEFGRIMFVSQDMISMIERGKRTPSFRFIIDLCKEFLINWNWLFNGEGEKYLDVLENLELSQEIKDLTNDLYSLDEEDREAIKTLIKNIKSKIKNQKES